MGIKTKYVQTLYLRALCSTSCFSSSLWKGHFSASCVSENWSTIPSLHDLSFLTSPCPSLGSICILTSAGSYLRTLLVSLVPGLFESPLTILFMQMFKNHRKHMYMALMFRTPVAFLLGETKYFEYKECYWF